MEQVARNKKSAYLVGLKSVLTSVKEEVEMAKWRTWPQSTLQQERNASASLEPWDKTKTEPGKLVKFLEPVLIFLFLKPYYTPCSNNFSFQCFQLENSNQ